MNALKMGRVVNKEKNIVRIKWVSDESSALAVPSPFYGDSRSLAKAIQKTKGGSPLLEAATKAANVQSGIISQMRELEFQSNSGITNNTVKRTKKLNFSHLLEELTGTQKILLSSIKTLSVTIENLSAANSNVEKKILRKITTLMRNKLDHSRFAPK